MEIRSIMVRLINLVTISAYRMDVYRWAPMYSHRRSHEGQQSTKVCHMYFWRETAPSYKID